MNNMVPQLQNTLLSVHMASLVYGMFSGAGSRRTAGERISAMASESTPTSAPAEAGLDSLMRSTISGDVASGIKSITG